MHAKYAFKKIYATPFSEINKRKKPTIRATPTIVVVNIIYFSSGYFRAKYISFVEHTFLMLKLGLLIQ